MNLKEQLNTLVDEYKNFMGFSWFPEFDLQTKIASLVIADSQGFESAAVTTYQPITGQHSLCVSVNLELSKYLMFHEFTHMHDSEIYVNGDKVRYAGLSGYTEYHASQIELACLVGAETIGCIPSFSMNKIISTFAGNKTVLQYVKEKYQHAKDLFSRDDFPSNISTDPFHHSNVEYVRIKKWRSVKTTNGINYIECDMSTTATKSYIDDLTYFTVFFPDEDEITTFEINDTLINQLNNIESQYQSQFFKQGRPLCFHKGKEYADGFVSEGKIEYASPEYYGIWAYNGNAVCEINDRLSFDFALATVAYSGFMYGFT